MRKPIYLGIAVGLLIVAGGFIVLSRFTHQNTTQLQLSFNAGHPDRVQISTLEPIPAGSVRSQAVETRTQTFNGVRIELIRFQSPVWGKEVGTRAEVCYALPTEIEDFQKDWALAEVTLSVNGYLFPVQA